MKKLGLTTQKGTSKGGIDMGVLKNIWANMNKEQKDGLLEAFTGEGYNVPTESEDILSTIVNNIPPKVIEGFLEKAMSGNQEQKSNLNYD